MQFGLFYEAPEDPRRTHGERLVEMLDLIVYGESLGFDVAWLAEIHFGGPFSLLSAPLMLVPAIAARTQVKDFRYGARDVCFIHSLPAAESG